MSQIRQILAVIDPGVSAQPCVHKAARLARAFGATLELFICDTSPQLCADRFYAAEFCDAAREGIRAGHHGQLESLAGPIRQLGVHVSSDVVFRDSLHAGIIEKVRESRPDLVVKDTHYHGVMRRALFTNTDWHLIRECPAALLLTNPITWRSLVRFAAAIDPGHAHDKPATLDHELLLLTERFALSLAGDARAVHVVDTAPIHAGSAAVARRFAGKTPIDGTLLESVRLAHHRELETVVSQHPNFAGFADLVEGTPVDALPQYVTANAIDVLVMGAVARGTIEALLVGRTAEKVLDRLPCDILIWKPSRLMAEMLSNQRAA